MNIEKISTEVISDGFSVVKDYFTISKDQEELIDNFLNGKKFERGAVYRTSNILELPENIFQLVYNEDIKNVFTKLSSDIRCREVFITHECKTDILTRPNQLHFDRLRSLKVMVYITDVNEKCGPLSVVPGSHKKSCLLRRAFIKMPYENRLNIIKKHYPHLYESPTKICGGKGTIIFFDSDVFHLGGKNEIGHERKIIRSHWYPNLQWRNNS